MPWLYSVTLRGISFVVMLRDKFISKSEALLQNQSATQICVVMRQQYGFSAPVLQSSFRGETRGGLGRLFLKARRKRTTENKRPQETIEMSNQRVLIRPFFGNGSRFFVLFLYNYKSSRI